MKQKNFQTKLTRDMLEALHNIIQTLLSTKVQDDIDKLHFAVLDEIRHRFYQKLDIIQKDYQVSFTPAQAMAIRILATDYMQDVKTYTGNALHQIANEVNKQYQ